MKYKFQTTQGKVEIDTLERTSHWEGQLIPVHVSVDAFGKFIFSHPNRLNHLYRFSTTDDNAVLEEKDWVEIQSVPKDSGVPNEE